MLPIHYGAEPVAQGDPKSEFPTLEQGSLDWYHESTLVQPVLFMAPRLAGEHSERKWRDHQAFTTNGLSTQNQAQPTELSDQAL